MNDRLPFRIGLGHDSHRLVAGGPLRLGGIDIPFDRHLAGHSDADALLHALTDALFGALAAGDIGERFPNWDEDNLNRDSAEFVTIARDFVHKAGYQIGNVDCTVMAEAPKLGPYKRRMAERIASILRISVDRVSVKAKTGEGVGPVGQGQLIEVHSAVLLTTTN